MLGMRGMRDRWTESLERAGKLMDKGMVLVDKGVELIDKVIEYIENLERVTKSLIPMIEQQQKVLEQDLELKKAEQRRVEMATVEEETIRKSKKERRQRIK